MNNTIDSCRNITFNSRYLRINHEETIPRKVYEAIYKSDGIEEFLNAGKPKTFLEKLRDLFKKDEILDVYYGYEKMPGKDIFAKKSMLHFSFGKSNVMDKFYLLEETQKGIRRKEGSIPKSGEHPLFKAPSETADDKLVKRLEELKDLDTLLR